MTEKYRTKLLEVIVIGRSRSAWEWRVLCGDDAIVNGFEATREAARYEGYDAMFLLLASGC